MTDTCHKWLPPTISPELSVLCCALLCENFKCPHCSKAMEEGREEYCQKEWKGVRFLMVSVFVIYTLRLINLEQSSSFWFQQSWKEKVASKGNRQSVRLPSPPTKETNILDLRCYVLNTTWWTCAILFWEGWWWKNTPWTSSYFMLSHPQKFFPVYIQLTPTIWKHSLNKNKYILVRLKVPVSSKV